MCPGVVSTIFCRILSWSEFRACRRLFGIWSGVGDQVGGALEKRESMCGTVSWMAFR